MVGKKDGVRVGARVRIGALAGAAALLCGVAGSSAAVAASDDEGFGKDAWWYVGMGLPEAHEISTGEGVTIAVIDGPIDPTVPELRGQDVTAVKNLCGGEARGTGPIAAHGTSVAVNIVGSGRGTLPGGGGVKGIAPGAALRSYAIDSSAEDGIQCGATPESKAVGDAIDLSVEDGADIITYSGGGATPGQERDAVESALAAGVVVVASAGNIPEGAVSVTYPAAYPGVVAVAAVDRNANPWSGNVKGNREAFVISAPGVEVPTGSFDGNTWRSDAVVSGTSEAAPLVAGGLAVVAAEYPDATANQLIQHLIRNPGGTREFGFDPETGYGIISVPKMLESDPTQWPDVNPLIEAAGASDGSSDAASGGGSGPSSEESEGTPVAASSSDDGGGVPMWLLLAGGLGALAVIGAVVAAVVMSSRRSNAPPGPGVAPTASGWGGGGHG